MRTAVSVLACDIGGGSGRVLKVDYTGSGLELKSIARFGNESVKVGKSLYWDVIGILKGVKAGIGTAKSLGVKPAAIGIDTWGNDFAFLDKKGFMLENPYSYRDARTEKTVAQVNASIGGSELYSRNGIQQVRMNTLYQLVSLANDRPYVFDAADKFLFIPDLISYFLTGERFNEYTLASISQLYNYGKGDWDKELMEQLGIPSRLFSPIIYPGVQYGTINPSVCKELNVEPVPVVTVGAHDTASAVAAVPEPDLQTIYISSGTWSIIGTETNAPVINDMAYRFNFSNEGGVGGTIRLLKNVMGMWIIQEIRRKFASEGRDYSFEELSLLAREEEPFDSVIDPDDESFYEPTDMPQAIREYCRKTGQKIPQNDGQIVLVSLQSLAHKYRYVIEKLELLVGRSLDNIHIIGGGSQNTLLCQMTASCCGKVVYAGPIEATALGNATTQLISLGELASMKEARSLIRESFPLIEYAPCGHACWNESYARFIRITGLE